MAYHHDQHMLNFPQGGDVIVRGLYDDESNCDHDQIISGNVNGDSSAAICMQQLFLMNQTGPPGTPVHYLMTYDHDHHQTAKVVEMMRSSKYAKPAQQLLLELCRSSHTFPRNRNDPNPKSPSTTTTTGTAAHDRKNMNLQLLSMLDQVERRYNIYCMQLKAVARSFEVIMGIGAATPYTCVAQKAMSRHFRCLKDAVAVQLKESGVIMGKTPRLKMLEVKLRNQRAIQLMEQDVWRPQRGLPDRSVNILRAWLFEHFFDPYPSDAGKHMLATQTGLSRNQVSNWFINARVRLWKPMVEEMYKREIEEEEDKEHQQTAVQDTEKGKRSKLNASESDIAIYYSNCLTENEDVVVQHSTTNDAGEVSLILGLRYASNMPRSNT